jgi:hypothetical protein
MDKKLKDAAVGAGAVGAALAIGPAAAVIKPAWDLFQFLRGDAADTRRDAAVNGIFDAIADLGNYDRAEAESRFIVIMATATQEQKDLIFESFRAIVFSRSEAARRYICLVTAECIVHCQGKPDTFFKRAAWLLERCEEGDVLVLEEACRDTVVALRGPPSGEVPLSVLWEFYGGGVAVDVYLPAPKGETKTWRASGEISGAHEPRYSDCYSIVAESRVGRGDGTGFQVVFPLAEGHIQRLAKLFAR